MADLTQQQWKDQLVKDEGAVILDVRSDLEMEEGYIPNAMQMDIQNPGEFMEKAKTLDPEKNYYIYCRSGGRSHQACLVFNSLGIKNTYNLIGGIEAWEDELTH